MEFILDYLLFLIKGVFSGQLVQYICHNIVLSRNGRGARA